MRYKITSTIEYGLVSSQFEKLSLMYYTNLTGLQKTYLSFTESDFSFGITTGMQSGDDLVE